MYSCECKIVHKNTTLFILSFKVYANPNETLLFSAFDLLNLWYKEFCYIWEVRKNTCWFCQKFCDKHLIAAGSLASSYVGPTVKLSARNVKNLFHCSGSLFFPYGPYQKTHACHNIFTGPLGVTWGMLQGAWSKQKAHHHRTTGQPSFPWPPPEQVPRYGPPCNHSNKEIQSISRLDLSLLNVDF